jgi:hypothetical protein
MRDIYNDKAALTREELRGRSKTHAVLDKLQVEETPHGRWFVRHVLDPYNCVDYLFFAHPLLIELLPMNPDVITIDCTYKTNRFNMPLLHITGVNAMGNTFNIAYDFMPSESEEQYGVSASNLVELFREANTYPRCFILDNETALRNALTEHFPNMPQRQCEWHNNKRVNVQATEKAFEKRKGDTEEDIEERQEKMKAFMGVWQGLVNADTEEDFNEAWRKLQDEYREYPRLIRYIKEKQLPLRDYWAKYLTKFLPKFGEKVSSRGEGAHAGLKAALGHRTQGSLFDVVNRIEQMVVRQHATVKDGLLMSYSRVRQAHRIPEFAQLHHKVTPMALDHILKQMKLAKANSNKVSRCTGAFTAQFGLPCYHELDRLLHVQPQLTITIEMVDQHWHYEPARMNAPPQPPIPRDPVTVVTKGRPKEKTKRSNKPLQDAIDPITGTQRIASQFEVVERREQSQTKTSQPKKVTKRVAEGTQTDSPPPKRAREAPKPTAYEQFLDADRSLQSALSKARTSGHLKEGILDSNTNTAPSHGVGTAAIASQGLQGTLSLRKSTRKRKPSQKLLD